MSYCQTANGLLLAQGSRRLPHRPADEEPVDCFAFLHPSFEEYLAARGKTSKPPTAARIPLDSLHATVRGWVNHARYGDTWGLRRAVFGDTPLLLAGEGAGE